MEKLFRVMNDGFVFRIISEEAAMALLPYETIVGLYPDDTDTEIESTEELASFASNHCGDLALEVGFTREIFNDSTSEVITLEDMRDHYLVYKELPLFLRTLCKRHKWSKVDIKGGYMFFDYDNNKVLTVNKTAQTAEIKPITNL